MNEEHIIPEALGGTLIIYRVCKQCNNHLGRYVDKNLSEDWFIQKSRARLKVFGKKGKIRLPLRTGSLDTGEKIRVAANQETGEIEAELLGQLVNGFDATEAQLHILGRDASETLDVIKVRLTHLTFPRLGPVVADSINPISRMAKATVPVASDTKPALVQQAIIKIAYEMAWYWLEDRYLEDDTARIMRNLILDTNVPDRWEAKYPLFGRTQRISGNAGAAVTSAFPDHHIVMLWPDLNHVGVYVRVFDDYEGWFRVSSQRERYDLWRTKTLLIDPKTGATEEI